MVFQRNRQHHSSPRLAQAIGRGLIALSLVAPAAFAGPFKIYGPQYAWVNNFNDHTNAIHGTFGAKNNADLTVNFNFDSYNLYGYPAIVRGSHYGWNPTDDHLLPRQVSAIKSLPASFSYEDSGTNLAGDFAYDLFLRHDANPGIPQTEVMIWGDHNSWPIGRPTATHVMTVNGQDYDLWEGNNSGAGYYVYTFIPSGTAGRPTLAAKGKLNVDIRSFLGWLQTHRSSDGHFSQDMYLDVMEAGFEVVRGQGQVHLSAKLRGKI